MSITVLRVSTPGAEDGLDKLVLRPITDIEKRTSTVETQLTGMAQGNNRDHKAVLQAIDRNHDDSTKKSDEITSELRGFKSEVRAGMKELQDDRQAYKDIRNMIQELVAHNGRGWWRRR